VRDVASGYFDKLLLTPVSRAALLLGPILAGAVILGLQASIVVGTGVLLGLGLALASARVLGGLLYEVSPLDVRVYVAVAALLGLVSLVATYLPAYRATRVDPMTGIRSE